MPVPLFIDPRYVDVDLAAEAKRLGILPGYTAPAAQRFTDPNGGAMRSYGDAIPILDDATRDREIDRLDAEGGIERLITRVFNQQSEGSCVGNAGTQGVQVLQAKQFGKDKVVQLSAISLYKQIGSSPGSGANCEDALTESQAVGILPLDTPENRARFGDKVMPHTGFYTPWPIDWKNTAKLFRVDECFIISSVPELETAGINGHPVIVGRAGHSICYQRPTKKQGRGYLYVNSWGDWGFGAGDFTYGFGFDSAGMVRSSAQWAYAVVSIIVPDYILAL